MQVFTNTFTLPTCPFPDDIADYLLLDIETTGILPSRSKIYLLGLGEFHALSENKISFTQFLLENMQDELQMLTILQEKMQKVKGFLTYAGSSFDLRFLQDCADAYGMDLHFSRPANIDLIRFAKKFKTILGLDSIKQRDVEAALGFHRNGNCEKTELIAYYHRYLEKREPEIKNLLLSNQANDLQGLILLSDFLLLDSFFTSGFAFAKCQNIGDSLELTFQSANRCPFCIRHRLSEFSSSLCPSFANPPFLNIQGTDLTLQLPVLHTEMKFFFPNYKDYVYLIRENRILHKSLAGYVSGSHKRKAAKEEVFLAKTSDFLPVIGNFPEKLYKTAYSDKSVFLELADALARPEIFFEILHFLLCKLHLIS